MIVEKLITASFRKPVVAVVLALAGAVLGGVWMNELPRDVFPDLSAPVFNVIVQDPAMSADELEMRVAIPMETALAGLPCCQLISRNFVACRIAKRKTCANSGGRLREHRSDAIE